MQDFITTNTKFLKTEKLIVLRKIISWYNLRYLFTNHSSTSLNIGKTQLNKVYSISEDKEYKRFYSPAYI